MEKFNNKETYLMYCSNWKSEYKQLSQTLREQKQDIRNTSMPSFTQYWNLRCNKKKATAMLEELKEAKKEAQRQYLASKEKELVMA